MGQQLTSRALPGTQAITIASEPQSAGLQVVPMTRGNSHAFPRIDLDCDCGAAGVDSDGPGLRRCEISRPLRCVAQGQPSARRPAVVRPDQTVGPGSTGPAAPRVSGDS